jgi:type IV pilus assembly protein PilV
MLASPKENPRAAVFGKSQKGAMLLEALIAVVIFSLGVLGLVGLQANATQAARNAKFRADANQVVSERIAILRFAPANLAGYAETDTNVSPLLPDGKRTTTVAGDTATVTVTWTVPGDSATQRHSVVTRVTANHN